MSDQAELKLKLVRTSRYLGLLAAIAGAAGLLVRVFGPPQSSVLWPSFYGAVAICLCGCALAIPGNSKVANHWQPSFWLSLGALALALGTLGLYLVTGFPKEPGRQGVMLAPVTGIVVLALALATLCLQHIRSQPFAQGLALMALIACALALTGYLQGTVALAELGTAFPMTLPAAILLCVLGLSVLLAQPGTGPMAVVTSHTPAGQVARRLLLPLFVLPAFMSFLFHRVARWGWYAPGLENAIFIFASMVTVGALLWWQIVTMYRADLRHQRLELKARQVESQFAELVQAVTDYAIYSLDPEGRINSWNTGAERIRGYAAEEVLGHPYSLLFCPEEADAGVPAQLLDKARSEGRVVHEGWQLRKDGSLFYAHTSLTRMDDARGRLLGYAKVTHDISPQRHAEEEQTKSQSILNTVVDPILVIDEKGMIETFNCAAEQVFGYRADEVLHRNVSMLMPAPQRQEHDDYLRHYLDTGQARVIGIGREVLARRRDGTVFPADLSVSEMTLGNRRKFTGIVRDITARKAAHDALERSEARLSMAMEAGNIGVWEVNAVSAEVVARGPVYERLAIPADGSRDLVNWFLLAHPDDRERLRAQLEQVREHGCNEVELEYRVKTLDGQWHWLLSRGRVSQWDSDGRALQVLGATVDVHKRKVTEEALRKNKMNLEIALKGASFHLWHLHVQDQRVEDMDALVESLGYNPGDETARTSFWSALLHPEDRARLQSIQLLPLPEELTETGIELRLRASDGSWRWMVARARTIESDRQGLPAIIAGTCMDITERKQAEEQLLRAAQHDSLTGLPNRALTYAFGERLLAAAPRNESRCAVMFVDLDRFKPINDTYGHPAGDEVLREVGDRLRRSVRGDDIVGRLGGDEFLVVLAHVSHLEDISHIARGCLVEIARPIFYKELELAVTPSIGISLYPDDGNCMDTLVNQADTAMYHAKQNGRNGFEFFTPAMSSRAKSLLSMEARLRRAVERGQFELVYQPVVDTETQQVVAAEALLRWPAEKIGPEEFIPLAESSGLILSLGEWVLQEACRQHKSWIETGFGPLRVSVNVSPLQFRQREFCAMIARTVADSGINPRHLQLEITENVIMQDLDSVVRSLHTLRETGIKIALDDFGKGYSSLNYLKVLPLDVVKVDKDFVHDLQVDGINLAITEAIITLGDRLGLQVIAEGVETEAVLQLLRARQCRHMQGYHLGYPAPATDFEARYRNSPVSLVPGPH